MTEASDTWPHYHSGPSKHVHALGVISLEFNSFEGSFFSLFSHHLRCKGVDADACWSIFSAMHESKHKGAIQSLFGHYEPDAEVQGHIEYVFDYFHRCNHNRNWLMHSVHSSFAHDAIHMQKSMKGHFDPVHVLSLSLAELRRIADEMHGGSLYVGRIVIYLARRDGLLPDAGLLSEILGPQALPEKPPLPDKLEPSQSPRYLIDTWFPPESSQE